MKLIYIVALLAALMVLGAGIASAKSVYVISNINANPTPIQAYDISGDQIVYQATNTVPSYAGGAVGLGIDTDSAYLFVTYEISNLISIVNATTMTVPATSPVTAPGASNLAGVVVDQDKQKVYTMDRNTAKLYVYSWNALNQTLTLDGIHILSGVSQAHGIALDETNDLLYVGDRTTQVEIFNTADWSSAGNFTVSQAVMGIAVDVPNGYVYTGNAYPPYGSIGLLSQYDLGSATETTVNIRTLTGYSTDNTVGLAVDQATGFVYVTTGNQGIGGSDRVLVFNSSLGLTDSTGDIGNPTGICVPGKDISYNPLNLVKTDGLTQVQLGSQLTYTISYDNAQNNNAVNNVMIVDALPSDVTYVSSTDGGVYDSVNHTVTWNIGTLASGASTQSVSVTVSVNWDAVVGSYLANAATINSDESAQTTTHDRDTEVIRNEAEIPEFPTIALPVLAIIGIAFFFQRRKNE